MTALVAFEIISDGDGVEDAPTPLVTISANFVVADAIVLDTTVVMSAFSAAVDIDVNAEADVDSDTEAAADIVVEADSAADTAADAIDDAADDTAEDADEKTSVATDGGIVEASSDIVLIPSIAPDVEDCEAKDDTIFVRAIDNVSTTLLLESKT